jgi:hypothetical protein
VRRIIVLGVVAIGLVYLYVLALVYGIGVNAAQRVPSWWSEIFPMRSALSWALISHFVVVLLVSLPFAWAIVRVYGRLSIAVSLGVALLIWGLFEAPLTLDALRSGGLFSKGLWLADTVQFIASLPILVLLFRRLLPSNNRFERSREASSVSQGGDR